MPLPAATMLDTMIEQSPEPGTIPEVRTLGAEFSEPTVLINGTPAGSGIGGSPTVLIGGEPALRLGDFVLGNYIIQTGSPDVQIG